MLIELSYPLSETTPKWPTNPDEQYYSVSDQTRGDVSTTSSVYHHMHNGTHMDTPRHFDPNGPTIEQLPIEDFYYTRPFVLRLDKKKGEMVTMQDVQAHLDELKTCDLLLIYTGYSSLRAKHPEQFMDDFPFLSPEFARYLRKELPLLEVSEAFPERTLRIFEDVNIGALAGISNIQAVCAFPVRWVGLEAAPIAMVAII